MENNNSKTALIILCSLIVIVAVSVLKAVQGGITTEDESELMYVSTGMGVVSQIPDGVWGNGTYTLDGYLSFSYPAAYASDDISGFPVSDPAMPSCDILKSVIVRDMNAKKINFEAETEPVIPEIEVLLRKADCGRKEYIPISLVNIQEELKLRGVKEKDIYTMLSLVPAYGENIGKGIVDGLIIDDGVADEEIVFKSSCANATVELLASGPAVFATECMEGAGSTYRYILAPHDGYIATITGITDTYSYDIIFDIANSIEIGSGI